MPVVRQHIQFLRNDRPIRLAEVGASDTLLDFLRLDQRLTGSKEGCAEGDCGACTVLVGRLHDGKLLYEPVNSCIRLLASLDGCHLVTIEHLRGKGGALHPIQQAMVDQHGSQCGFCTPGIVMALYALFMANPSPERAAIDTALQGNLCRCTGYAPIIKAAQTMADYAGNDEDLLVAERQAITQQLTQMQDGARVVTYKGEQTAILPADLDDLATILEDEQNPTLIAGCTDVGLWVTKFLHDISPAIFIGHLPQLKTIETKEDALVLGAGVTYSEAEEAMLAHYPHLGAYWNRIAGPQVRNMGTIGGNIANGSPIGDMPPVLMALGARIILRKGAERREVLLDDFFIDYGKQDRQSGDFLESIIIPPSNPSSLHAAYKISKRRDEDISTLAAAFYLTMEEEVITEARIAFGGMAATPKRASQAEQALVGGAFTLPNLMAAAELLEQDFTPLSDWRASAAYRMRVAKNLFQRFHADHAEAAPKLEAAE